MKWVLALLLALLASPAAADLPEGSYETARPIVLPKGFEGGMVYLPLDDAALAVGSVAEYRVVKDGAEETPYRMVVEDGAVLEKELSSTVVAWTEAGAPDSVRIVLDLGADPPSANLVRLTLRGDGFSAAATAGQSASTSESPTPLADTRVYRRGAGFEKTSLTIQPLTQRYLHLTLTREEGKLPRVEAVRVFSALTIRRRTEPVAATASFRQDARRQATVVELDPGRPVRDLAELRFTIAEPVFDRPVALAAAAVEPAPGEDIAYGWRGEARLARKKPAEPAVVAASIPEARFLRLSIANGDDRPLTVKGVELIRTRRGLIFSAEPRSRYALWYGREAAPAPSYDLSKLPLAPPDTLAEVALEPARALPVTPPAVPWSERHPALFWAMLAGVALVLVAVIIGAMRAAARGSG